MSTKWTPGPWFVGAQNDTLYVIDGPPSPAPYDGPIPKEYGPNVVATPGWRQPNHDANANLIAAAPELYDALEELRDYAAKEIQRGGAHHDPVWAKAADALRKARGEA